MSRPRVLAGLLLGLVSLYALIGFLLLPYIIQAYLIPMSADRLKRPIVVREVACNPFTLSLDVKGLEVRDPDQTPIIGFEELLVNLHAATWLLQAVSFDEIRLVMPFVAAKVNREGTLNLLGLVPPADETVAASPAPPPQKGEKKRLAIYIESLDIDQGVVEYLDESQSRPVFIDIVPIHISLRDFSTVEGSDNAYAFQAEIGKGESLSWEGSVSLDPIESDGRLALAGVQVGTFYQAVRDQFQFDVREGELAMSGRYHFSLEGGTPQVTVRDGTVSVQRLALAERGLEGPVVDIPDFEVQGIAFDLAGRSVTLGKVRSSDARFAARIDPDGVLNYQTLFTPVDGRQAVSTSSTAPAGPPWSIVVNEIELRNYQALFEDRTLARPSRLGIEALDLTVKDVALPFKDPFPVDLSLKLNRTGLIGLRGQLAMEPLAATLDLTLREIEIRPFQPYLDQFLNADVRDGTLDLSGSVHYAQVHPQGPLLRFQGNLAVNQFSVTDRDEFDEVVSWKSLAVNRLALDVDPTEVKITEVVWQQPAAHLVVRSDGGLNVSRLLTTGPQAVTAEVRPKAAPAPIIKIDRVNLVKGSATFRDQSIQPAVKTALTELSGTIKGLSSKEIAKADVALAGKVGAGAPLKISGQINPLTEDAFTDLVVLLEHLDLTTASPYAGKYAGYPIADGKLFLDLKYKIAKKALIGENNVLIDQLTFGKKTNSPDATSLPVPLAVALLKDRRGQIDVDLPVRGDLKDPDFRYGRVVLNALLNLLAKVATSPLSLLSGLVGAREDLNSIAFPPGRAQLGEDELQKVRTLEKVLTERPGLFLEIAGTADPEQDRPILADAKFRARLLEMQQLASGAAPTKPDTAISREEEARLVGEWYARQFGPVAQTSGPELTLSEQRARLMDTVPVREEDLRQLAQERASALRAGLLASGTVPEERVVLRDVEMVSMKGSSITTRLALAGREQRAVETGFIDRASRDPS